MHRSRMTLCFALVLVGCGVADDVAEVESGITNGAVVTDTRSGHVALQVWSTTSIDYYTFCSGTLMTNTVIISAKHCFEGLDDRRIFAWMGGQRREVGVRVDNPSWDVSKLTLSTPFSMPSWNRDRLTSSLNTKTLYRRAVSPFTNSQLNGRTLTCYGYAPGGFGTPTLRSAQLTATYNPNGGLAPINQPHTPVNSTGQLQEPGDSGGGCLAGYIGDPANSYRGQLVFPLAVCFYQTSPKFCAGPGSESWGAWSGL